VSDDPDGRRHVVFSEEGRYLQIEVFGDLDLNHARFMVEVVTPPGRRLTDHIQAITRFADLARCGRLRPALYPPHARGRRLSSVLQALDGALAGATHRDIAVALFGESRVGLDWTHPAGNMRDRVRKAITRGRFLMNGGYRQFFN
jgi:hypothetical protein